MQLLRFAINYFSIFKTKEDFGTDIRTATNGGRIAKRLSGLFDGCHDFLFAISFLLAVCASGTSQSAGADERAGPGAKVFGAERPAHHFLDVFIDVPALQVDKLA